MGWGEKKIRVDSEFFFWYGRWRTHLDCWKICMNHTHGDRGVFIALEKTKDVHCNSNSNAGHAVRKIRDLG